jgi:hypothetical protein
MVNYQQRLDRTFAALVDPPRRAILAQDESPVEIVLKAVPEGTEITFTHSRLHDRETRRTHEAGWTGSLDKLEARFAGGEAA